MNIALGLLLIFASAWILIGTIGLIEQFRKERKK